ncbi:cell envelope biogenesis protein TonB [Prevotella herbatica]|uniref:Cell envelope biogenesis protein TonB n=1 Tax=Prevotella herbatica TaxID=2801997 RepID=A0ABM7NZ37_9BACT|nr:energy transducer TonB [Prevotella herbatica]BCS85787.1 cell envelope biogenesis protein TonB [Prevotella herbatica]
MRKIDMTSKEWCDIIFEGKNKEYGAYKLRIDSARRNTIVTIVMVAIVALPFLFILLTILFTPKEKYNMDLDQVLSEMKPAENKYKLSAPKLLNVAHKKISKKDGKRTAFTAPVIMLDKDVTSSGLATNGDASKGTESNSVNIPADTTGFANKTTTHNGVNANTDKILFRVIEELPEFPGGATEYMKWLTRNLRYPKSAEEKKIDGKVVVSFIINKNGTISDIKIIKSLDPDCDNEVLRVMKKMPKWKPGTEKGHPVRTEYVIPVVFKGLTTTP